MLAIFNSNVNAGNEVSPPPHQQLAMVADGVISKLNSSKVWGKVVGRSRTKHCYNTVYDNWLIQSRRLTQSVRVTDW